MSLNCRFLLTILRGRGIGWSIGGTPDPFRRVLNASCVLTAVALLDPYTGAWTSEQAAHLARRTTFGATPAQLASLVAAGMSVAVDSIVDYPEVDFPLESRIADLPTGNGSTDFDRVKTPRADRDLEGGWLYRMVHSTYPLQQQFALFLHDHFVSEWGKIFSVVPEEVNRGNDGSGVEQSCVLTGGLPPDPNRRNDITVRLMRDQHNLFLTRGHGSFREMLIAITRDPCMLIYLDNRTNLKTRPQENYARELMELFSMGVGNYTEDDVREMARALTGETIQTACLLNWPFRYIFSASIHDTNPKTIFGTTVNSAVAGAETVQVIDLILERISRSSLSASHSQVPAAALYMSWKFLNWFVNPAIAIGDEVVRELATHFYYNTAEGGFRYNVRETLRKMLKSSFFYRPENVLKIYKHPADYVVTALRGLDLDDPNYTGSAYSWLRSMGMRLFEPPTVDGWQHGRIWINTSAVIARFNYANRLSSSAVLPDSQIDALLGNSIQDFDDDAGIMNYFASRLLLDSFSTEESAVFQQMFNEISSSATLSAPIRFRKKVRAALHLTMTMPRYQLK